ncbi:MAG: hypothetical protein KGL39_55840 [Patescibacteria group bacterium]|nr:hypothetical protein [Patescibacteria group bacterium]
MRKALLLVAALLGGCAAVPRDRLVFIRTDGQSIRGDMALEQQARIDATICKGQTQQSALGMPIVYTDPSLAGALDAAVVNGQRTGALSDVAKGCMAQKGYIQVPESEMDERIAEYKKTSSARKKLAQ